MNKVNIVDVRTPEKCRSENGEWNEEWGVCVVEPEGGEDFLIEQPFYDTYEEEDEFVWEYYGLMERKGAEKKEYLGPTSKEAKKLDELIMDEYDRDLDDLVVFEKNGGEFRVLFAWPKDYPAPPKR